MWDADADVVDYEFRIRGTTLDDDPARELVAIADGPVYHVTSGCLTPADSRVPVAKLPDGDWKPLRHVVTRVLPVASLPPAVSPQTTLRLIRSLHEKKPAILVSDGNAVRDWALMASEHRLHCLQFVAVGRTCMEECRGDAAVEPREEMPWRLSCSNRPSPVVNQTPASGR